MLYLLPKRGVLFTSLIAVGVASPQLAEAQPVADAGAPEVVSPSPDAGAPRPDEGSPPPPLAPSASGKGDAGAPPVTTEPAPPSSGAASGAGAGAEADPDDASARAAGRTNLRRPPPAGRGAVIGVIRSKGDGETLLDAQITVLGTRRVVFTDVDGQYRVDLPPGDYQFRIVYELHKITRVKNVHVEDGKLVRVDVKLQPDEASIEEVEAVEADVERSGVESQLMLRRNAAQASDAIGAADIAKSSDRNAADAIRRVVGATVVDGKYFYVRGLGDRYTNALLNGSPLPSPEPDRQAVPLDMFPTMVLSDLTVRKTFTPDMPGDFAGGSLSIHTRDLPREFLLQAKVGVGFNTISTFTNRLSYPGGSLDWLGFDDGSRKLPSTLPSYRISRLNPDGTINQSLTDYGKAVNGPMETNRAFTLPNGNASVVVGDTIKLGKKRELGYTVGATYTRSFSVRRDEIIRTYGVDPSRPGELVRFNDYRAETGTDNVGWSTIGNVSYRFDDDHKIAATALYSRQAQKEGRFIEGFNDEQGADIRDERLRFINRGLTYGQLRGEHRFSKLADAELKWTGMMARATLNDPDLRETVYVSDPTVGYAFRESTQSGQHFYAAQGETTRSAGLDWTQPLAPKIDGSIDNVPKIKAGSMVTLRGRSFSSRRFRFLRNPSADNAIFRQRPDDLFVDDNVGPALELEEWTRATDTFAARYDVVAAYAMGDVPITKRLRGIVGERVEASTQTVQSFDPFSSSSQRVESKLAKTDLLPSLGFIFKVTESHNLRLAASQTVARPQLRELAPFIFSDFFGARERLGNPNLDRTRIVNLDARYEIFPRSGEVLAVTFFHKRFSKPIEPIILPTSRGVISYQNADGAVNTGIELEARKRLDFISDKMNEFTALSNLTVVHSQVELNPTTAGTVTNTERPLAGQSPFVINLALDWEHEKTGTNFRVLYNVYGARVAEVGMNGLPDTYEQPRHMVDLSFGQSIGEHINVRATVANLLNAPVKFTQGVDQTAYIANRYLTGTTAWLMATYTY